MRVEVRAFGLKAMHEKRGQMQRHLAHALSISQNYIPAIEAGARQLGRRSWMPVEASAQRTQPFHEAGCETSRPVNRASAPESHSNRPYKP